MTETYIRARSPQQKQERMEEIMQVTDHLFQTHCFQDISLTDIAAALGWSRGNLYKYVTTKEEIFLRLYNQKQYTFLTDMYQNKAVHSIHSFANTFTKTLTAHKEYLKYQSILSQILEKNVTAAKLAESKSQSFHDREKMYAILKQLRPDLQDGQIRQLYITLIYEAVGLYNHTDITPLFKEAMTIAGISYNRHDSFTALMQNYTEMLIEHYTPPVHTKHNKR